MVLVVIKGRLFRTELDAVGDCKLDGCNGFLTPKTRMCVEVSVVVLVVVVVLEVVVCVVVRELEGMGFRKEGKRSRVREGRRWWSVIRRSQFVEVLLSLLLMKLKLVRRMKLLLVVVVVCFVAKTLGEDRELGLEAKLIGTVCPTS